MTRLQTRPKTSTAATAALTVALTGVLLLAGGTAAQALPMTPAPPVIADTWVDASGTAPARESFNIVYGNGTFVSVGTDLANEPIIQTSTDGKTWTTIASEDMPTGCITVDVTCTAFWKSLAFGNGLFVATGSFSGSSWSSTSADGLTWSAASRLPFFLQEQALTFGNGLFMSMSTGIGKATATSPDGITWTSTGLTTMGRHSCVTFGNGTFVIIYRQFTESSTDNGATWVAQTQPVGFNNPPTSCTFGQGVFSVVGGNDAGSQVITSADAVTWTLSEDSPALAKGNLRSTFEGGSALFAGGSWTPVADRVGYLLRSLDAGLTWTEVTTSGPQLTYGGTSGNGVVVAGGFSETAFPIQWSALPVDPIDPVDPVDPAPDAATLASTGADSINGDIVAQLAGGSLLLLAAGVAALTFRRRRTI